LVDAPSEVHAANRARVSRKKSAASRRLASAPWARSTEVADSFHAGFGGFVGLRPPATVRSFLTVRPQRLRPLRRRSPVRAVPACVVLRSRLLGLLSWGSSIPFARHRHCVHSRSGVAPCEALPLLRIEPARFDRVPFLPFLPAPTFCSAADPLAETRRSLAARRFVAPCSRPWGSPCFQRVVALRLRRPRGRHGLQPKSKIVSRHSRWRRPFEAFPSPAASPSSPPSSEEDGVHRRFVPSRRWSRGVVRTRIMACAVTRASRNASRTSTSRLCSTEESVVSSDVAVRRHPMLPWALDAKAFRLDSSSPSVARWCARVLGVAQVTPCRSHSHFHVKERVSLTEVVETMPSR